MSDDPAEFFQERARKPTATPRGLKQHRRNPRFPTSELPQDKPANPAVSGGRPIGEMIPMPVYTWTSQEGTFSQGQQKLLAKAVTDIHCSATGAPRSFVRIIFNTYPEGNGFVAETSSATVFLLCHIRAGRTMETKQSMLKKLNDAAVTIGGVSSDALAIILEEIPTGNGMEFGLILPGTTPEEEKQWLKEHRQ
jgi:phenylpyruvate tautomerase PptA (4-oxalocrotonate tautomerase family)